MSGPNRPVLPIKCDQCEYNTPMVIQVTICTTDPNMPGSSEYKKIQICPLCIDEVARMLTRRRDEALRSGPKIVGPR